MNSTHNTSRRSTAATPASIDHASEQPATRHDLKPRAPTDDCAGMLDAGLRCGWTLFLTAVLHAPDLDYEEHEELCVCNTKAPKQLEFF
jgi:hypothetical protein